MSLSEDAIQYIKNNKAALIEKYADPTAYPSYKHPTIIFMAGSPGAGKTEVTLELLIAFEKRGIKVVRIDPDEIRKDCPGYVGTNAHEFQSASSIGVEKLFDSVRKHSQNAIVDGTLAHLGAAKKNIDRVVAKGDKVGIIYVYQDPLRAWEFTSKREALESRKIEKETFINAFLSAPQNVDELKAQYGTGIKVFLVIKDFNNKTNKIHVNVDKIEHYLKKTYTAEELRGLLP